MRAVVLVGGEGTRLRPLTFEQPKQMLPVAQLPMIERVLEQLARHGVSEAVLSLGYKPEVFERHFAGSTWRDMRIVFAVEPPTLLDTAGAIAFAARAAGITETFVAVNGDVLTDLDLTAVVEFHKSVHAEATIALTPVDDPSSFGVVPTDADGRVKAFIEKPKREDAPTNYINAGTYVLEPSFLDLVPVGERVSIERETFPKLAEKKTLFAVESEAYWLDTGTAEKYLQANLDYLRGFRPLPPLPIATLNGDNWSVGESSIAGSVQNSLIGANCFIEEGAKVIGSVLGEGVTVSSGSFIENAVLFDRVKIAPDVSVMNSIIGADTTIEEGSRIENHSVVGFSDVVQAKSVISNVRLGVN